MSQFFRTSNAGNSVLSITATGPLTANGLSGSAQTGNVTLALATPLAVQYGGTGLATLTANNLLYGLGTSPVGLITPGTAGQVLTSNGAAPPSFQNAVSGTSIIGTSNQVLANGTSGVAQTGAVTLTTPQDIAATSNVTFNSIKTGDGVVATPSYSFTSAVSTGMYKTAGGLGFSVAGIEYIDIASTGVVTFPISITVTNLTKTNIFAMGFTSGAGNLVDVGSQTVYGFTDTTAPRTMTLTTPGTPGRIVIVKDQSGGAGTNNITVSVNGGANIDGAATFVINTNYGSATFYDNGSQYFVM